MASDILRLVSRTQPKEGWFARGGSHAHEGRSVISKKSEKEDMVTTNLKVSQ